MNTCIIKASIASKSSASKHITISNVNYREEERETLSQLPVVDLGEDFVFIEKELEAESCTSANENNDRLMINDTQPKKQLSLEAWSKGHIIGLKV